jgi:hypothetical protein
MKSNKQRRAELNRKRQSRLEKASAEQLIDKHNKEVEAFARSVPVNHQLLMPNNSYCISDFALRGYYLDVPFDCVVCGKSEVWTALQQKWWYEVAKGEQYSTARRCRACRKKERDRKNEARRIHQEGLERKANAKAKKTS